MPLLTAQTLEPYFTRRLVCEVTLEWSISCLPALSHKTLVPEFGHFCLAVVCPFVGRPANGGAVGIPPQSNVHVAATAGKTSIHRDSRGTWTPFLPSLKIVTYSEISGPKDSMIGYLVHGWQRIAHFPLASGG